MNIQYYWYYRIKINAYYPKFKDRNNALNDIKKGIQILNGKYPDEPPLELTNFNEKDLVFCVRISLEFTDSEDNNLNNLMELFEKRIDLLQQYLFYDAEWKDYKIHDKETVSLSGKEPEEYRGLFRVSNGLVIDEPFWMKLAEDGFFKKIIFNANGLYYIRFLNDLYYHNQEIVVIMPVTEDLDQETFETKLRNLCDENYFQELNLFWPEGGAEEKIFDDYDTGERYPDTIIFIIKCEGLQLPDFFQEYCKEHISNVHIEMVDEFKGV